jgi:hypothetical protein
MRSRASTPNLTSLADIFVSPELEFVSHHQGGTRRRSSVVSVCGDKR